VDSGCGQYIRGKLHQRNMFVGGGMENYIRFKFRENFVHSGTFPDRSYSEKNLCIIFFRKLLHPVFAQQARARGDGLVQERIGGLPLLLGQGHAALRQAQIMQDAAVDFEAELKEGLESMKASGNLQAGAKAKVAGGKGGKITMRAGDLEGRAPYGMLLEYGTLNISARPWLLPLFAKYSQLLTRAFAAIGRRL